MKSHKSIIQVFSIFHATPCCNPKGYRWYSRGGGQPVVSYRFTNIPIHAGVNATRDNPSTWLMN